ncbi:MAG: diguanylate cyclase [Alphaproteobacteria bacterium]|nr:diguanylate cyclase [Rhodospirillales bacterium]MCW9044742.1 diguanylate cyclase [Alphaproteobacteria bacterium]
MKNSNASLLAAVLNSGEPGTIVLDAEAHVVFWNDWLSYVSLISQEEAKGKTLDEIFPSLKESSLLSSITKILVEKGEIKLSSPDTDGMFPFKTADNEPMILAVTIRHLSADGENHCLVQVRDRSVKAKEDKLLRQQTATLEVLADNYLISEMNTRAIIDNAMEAIITLDSQGKIESLNPAAEDIFSLQVVDVLGKGLEVLMGEPWKVNGEAFSIDKVNDCGLHLETIGKHSLSGNFHLEISICRMQVDGNNRYIMTGRDITDRKDAEARIEYMAFNDSLTDLPNRVLFRERLNQAMINSRRSGTGFSLMAMDLDYFKQVNDTFGHHVGDQFLVSMASRIKQAVRETDTVARLGGDEFAVIITNLISPERAAHVAETIVKTISQPLAIDGHEFNGSASVGVAFFPTHANDEDELMVYADRALYQAKDQGRGRYVFFEEGMAGDPN